MRDSKHRQDAYTNGSSPDGWGAATGYVLVGFGFMGVALIAAGFTLSGLEIRFRRAASHLFGAGLFHRRPLLFTCIFGLLAFILTFAIPRRRIPLV